MIETDPARRSSHMEGLGLLLHFSPGRKGLARFVAGSKLAEY